MNGLIMCGAWESIRYFSNGFGSGENSRFDRKPTSYAVDIRNPEWYGKKKTKFLHFDEKRHKTTRHYRKSIKSG